MPFSRIAELKIKEAMAEGVFDNLPNAGKPIDLEEYFSTPEELRMAHSILRNANCAPAEVELLKEIARLEEEASRETDASTRESLKRRATERRTELHVRLERLRR